MWTNLPQEKSCTHTLNPPLGRLARPGITCGAFETSEAWATPPEERISLLRGAAWASRSFKSPGGDAGVQARSWRCEIKASHSSLPLPKLTEMGYLWGWVICNCPTVNYFLPTNLTTSYGLLSIGNWRKEDLCYVMTESLAILPLAIMWKIKNIPNELGDLAGVIYRQNAWSGYRKYKRRKIYQRKDY